MNIVIISGKIIEEVEFKFIYSKDKKEKHTSIARYKMELENGSVIKIYGYDDIADILYRNIGQKVYSEGIIDSNMDVELKYIVIV